MRLRAPFVFGCALALSACQSRREDEHVRDAFDRFSQCVVGAPLAKEESARARLRAIELTILGDPSQRGLPPNERWPRRCKGETSGLHSALAGKKQNRRTEDEALQTKLYAQVVAFDARADLDGLAEVLDASRAAGFSAKEIPGARRAPEPTKPMLAPPEPIPLEYVGVGSTPSPTQTIELRKPERRLCTDPFGKQPIACKRIGTSVGQLLVAASPQGEVWYYDRQKANESRELVVTSLDGRKRQHSLQKGFDVNAVRVEADALVTLDVNRESNRFLLSVEREGTPPKSLGGPFEDRGRSLYSSQRSPFLLGDFLVFESKAGIEVRRIQREPLKLLEPETVLTAESVMPLVEGNLLVLAGHASNVGKSGVAIHDGTRWFSHDVELHAPRAVAPNGRGVVFFAPGEDQSIREVRCDIGGCSVRTKKLNLSRRFCGPAFAPLDDRALVMWRSDLGDVRMRIGPLPNLDAAEERVVLDEGPPPDDASASECIQLIPQGKRVLAVIESFRKGRLPLLIDASGAVQELRLERP